MYDDDEDWDDHEEAPTHVLKIPESDAQMKPLPAQIPGGLVEAWCKERVDRWLDNSSLDTFVAKVVFERLQAELDTWIEESVQKRTIELIEEFFTGARPLTDRHGFDSGEKVPLGDVILAKVDKDLKATKDQYGNKRNAIEDIAQKAIYEPLKDDLRKLLRKVRDEHAERAERFVSKLLSEGIKEIAG